mmetsp:Transcript_16098/g.25063  ORF Transcript_16098/g.25063 Transcript_16098/m.25063 type:complete len:81 (-) Transcript_16098:428-670(-)
MRDTLRLSGGFGGVGYYYYCCCCCWCWKRNMKVDQDNWLWVVAVVGGWESLELKKKGCMSESRKMKVDSVLSVLWVQGYH